MYLTSKSVQSRRALRRGYLPTYQELLHRSDLLLALPQAEALKHAAEENWVARPSAVTGKSYPAVSKAYYQAVHRVLSRAVPVNDALAALEQELRRELADRRGSSQN
jgi:trehalose/maltose transport system substrate-binding protein